MSTPRSEDVRALRRDKYGDDPKADMAQDVARLARGEPLAYVIGWMPFLGLAIHLDSRPLIPRPETEWWTEMLIAHLGERFNDKPFAFLDMCAGSGAIGLAVLAKLPNALVTFAEVVPAHIKLIRKNLNVNTPDTSRALLYESDLFGGLPPEARYDVIATNPPYIPEARVLPKSVTDYEPPEALYAGADGLAFVRRILHEAPVRLREQSGELWLECDSTHAKDAEALAREAGAIRAKLHPDQYGRPRLLVSYW